MRVTQNEVHTQWGQLWGHIRLSLKTFKFFIKKVITIFDDLHILPQNLPHCVWTLLYQVKYFMNLIHSHDVSLFDIWCIIDTFLTYMISYGFLFLFILPPSFHIIPNDDKCREHSYCPNKTTCFILIWEYMNSDMGVFWLSISSNHHQLWPAMWPWIWLQSRSYTCPRCETPHRLQLKFHLVMVARYVICQHFGFSDRCNATNDTCLEFP